MVDWTDETSQALEGHRYQGSGKVGIPLDMFVLAVLYVGPVPDHSKVFESIEVPTDN